MSYKPIACARYDYIEIACMRHYELAVSLLSGDVVHGRAQTTRIVNKEEFLALLCDDQQTKEIRLDKIHKIRTLSNNAAFDTVVINSDAT